MVRAMRDVYIYDAVRTPRGRGKAGKGKLSGIHPQELLAQTLNHMAGRLELNKEDVEDVVIGCVSQVKEQGACIARNALIAGHWPESVTGTTVNRFCGSGLQGVNFAAMGVGSGFQDVAIGGGVESMSRVPMGSDGAMLDGLNTKLREKRSPWFPRASPPTSSQPWRSFGRKDDGRVRSRRARPKRHVAVEEGRFRPSPCSRSWATTAIRGSGTPTSIPRPGHHRSKSTRWT